jgi:hypothetical protein
LWKERGKIAQARKRLNKIFSSFEKSDDTPDLREAKALLAELSPGSDTNRDKQRKKQKLMRGTSPKIHSV